MPGDDEIPDWGPGDPTFEVLSIEEPSHIVFWSERPRRARRGVERAPMRLTWALALLPLVRDRTDLRHRLRLDLGHLPVRCRATAATSSTGPR